MPEISTQTLLTINRQLPALADSPGNYNLEGMFLAAIGNHAEILKIAYRILMDILPSPVKFIKAEHCASALSGPRWTPNQFMYTNNSELKIFADRKVNSKTFLHDIKDICYGPDDQHLNDILGTMERHHGWEQALQQSGRHALFIFLSNTSMYVFTNVTNTELICRLNTLFINRILNENRIVCPEYANVLTHLGNLRFQEAFDSMWEFLNWPINKDRVAKQIAQFLELTNQNIKQNLESELIRIDNEIEHFNHSLEMLYNDRDRKHRELFARINETIRSTSFEALAPYLQNHPYIKSINISGNTGELRVYLEAPLKYWDETAAELTLERIRQTERTSGTPGKAGLLEKIFLKDEYEIICTSCITLKPEINHVGTSTQGPTENAVTHPHLSDMNCLGNNRPLIVNAMRQGDWILMLEQIIATAFNLNIYDSPVWNSLMAKFSYSNTVKFLRDTKTGEHLSFTEAMEKEVQQHNDQPEMEPETAETNPDGDAEPVEEIELGF